MTMPRESRRVVTVLFADLVSSTELGEQLDPEPLRAVLRRYFDVCRAVIERHGGTVEKFIGDAVMAVFGIPASHEDDALRAARAGLELRSSVSALGAEVANTWPVELHVRVGIETGEVMAAADDANETMVTGDVVNVAARLQSVAAQDEVWVGGTTARRIRDVADLEQLGPLALKGKAEPVTASRLAAVRGVQEVSRELDAPLVGRAAELQRLTTLLTDAIKGAPKLVTVLGPAGIGKSRLVRELLVGLNGRATVLRGRCLPYGHGITYWPVAEVFRGAAGITAGDSREVALSKLRELALDADNADVITDGVAAVIGLIDAKAPAEELAWAVRQLLGHLARRSPLVIVVDDIQWAEPALLDLLEQIVALARDGHLAVLTMARPELLDARPTWPSVGEIVRLEPLDPRTAEEQLNALIASLVVSANVRKRVLDSAEGNPLFVEQFVAMLREAGDLAGQSADDSIAVPPEIGALLAARLDQLPRMEQHVLEYASVVGRVFWWGSVSHLAAGLDEIQIGPALTSLIRRGLIRADATTFVGDEAFRFHHLLLRDAAYARIPKELRADLHGRFAAWLEGRTRERLAEYQEIVAHHYLEAHRYFAEVGKAAESSRAAENAFTHLVSAGRRALRRQDDGSVASLWGKAYQLPLQTQRRAQLDLVPDLARALASSAALKSAVPLMQGALDAPEADDQSLRSRLEIADAYLHGFADQSGWDPTAMRGAADKWVPLLTQAGDYGGLARAWELRRVVSWGELRVGDAEEARRQVELYAEKAGEEYLARGVWGIGAEFYGPMPVADAMNKLTNELATSGADPTAEPRIRFSLAGLYAMVGDIEAARANVEACTRLWDELGMHMIALGNREMTAWTEFIAGDPANAEAALRASTEQLRKIGNFAWLGGQLGLLSMAIAAQGRSVEAMAVADEADSMTDPGDLGNRVFIGLTRGAALRTAGEPEKALGYIESPLERLRDADVLLFIGDLQLERARILHALGLADGARDALDRAIEAWSRKGNLMGLSVIDALREEIAASAAQPAG